MSNLEFIELNLKEVTDNIEKAYENSILNQIDLI